MNDEKTLMAFKCISNFVIDLATVFNIKSVKLYKRLISKTQITHDEAIKKHITIFTNFCTLNNDLILNKDKSKLVSPRISYSDNVFIDMNVVFNMADNETMNAIWNHLLTISAILYPSGHAKDVLLSNKNQPEDSKNETDFLQNLMQKVEQNVSPNTNPMDAVNQMMSSGVFNEMLNGMQGGISNGSLDMGKLLGMVQGMVSTLGQNIGDDPDAKQALNMINSLSSMMGNSGNGAPPDMSMLTTMMGGLMNNMNNKIEEVKK